MMVHPAPFDVLTPRIIAASMFEIRYTGKEAHASAFPEMGINAADAMTIAQTSIGLLRQHILPTDRIHGIITHGGDAPNIVPAFSARFVARFDHRTAEQLRRAFTAAEAGASAAAQNWNHRGNKPCSKCC